MDFILIPDSSSLIETKTFSISNGKYSIPISFSVRTSLLGILPNTNIIDLEPLYHSDFGRHHQNWKLEGWRVLTLSMVVVVSSSMYYLFGLPISNTIAKIAMVKEEWCNDVRLPPCRPHGTERIGGGISSNIRRSPPQLLLYRRQY